MVINYLRLSFRIFTRQKFYSLLNIFGLASGMATVILIMLYVVDELGFDRFHRYEADIYRVVENQHYSGQPVFPVAVTPGPLAESLKAEFPEVEMATRVSFVWNAFQNGENRFDTHGIHVDFDFFTMFDFKLLRGNPTTALNEVNSVILTEKLASKLFGQENAVGKMVKVNREREVLVTAILKDVPPSSHLQFDFIMPMSRRLLEAPVLKDDWGSNSLYTYVKLFSGTPQNEFDAKIEGHIKKKIDGSVTDLFLQPLADIHLDEVNFVADAAVKGNKQYVQIFSVVALFILAIACINFMNLSTARSFKRAKEVGLRKTIGAQRYQLVGQFLGESVVVSLVSLAIALLMVDLLLTPFNALTQKSLTLEYSDLKSGIIPICLLAALVTGLLAGSYPALFLSAFQPADVLKGKLTTAPAGANFRRMLVVLQFGISIVMISGTLVIYSQMAFIRNINLGWERQNVVMLPNVAGYKTLKNRLEGYPGIMGVSASNQHPSYVMRSTSGVTWNGKPEDETVLFHVQAIDYDYIETMKIEMLKGRDFSKTSPGDTLTILINEEAMDILGFDDPVGEYLKMEGDTSYQIIGIVKNFHFKSVHDRIEPLVLYLGHEELTNVMVRFDGEPEGAIETIANIWQETNSDQLFSYRFLDEEFDKLYRSESQTGTICKYFAILAIVISCLGLFGLAAYTTERRRKEYGIRKVFGASVSRLFFIAAVEFLALVIIAFLVSVPVAWYWMKVWLDGFAYHVELSWSIFAASGLLAVVIALITVSYQAGRAGLINPAKTLRAE